ncbi:NAD-dependent epimerase/dehydratase family protein [Pseudoxanthomonas sp.]|uniref:NAD-dependent epimerase/dehydratase family protein n=1 Tax=Pseudoxanthomonas sp. TaxID=1871049 RepID=UPI0025834780|nr:NAD-dependent epimerase/dehydratase family protein [Pseudoxanthomonas sp.]MCR6686576.1 NAD-dependent epimerase/dehydratase family protein [Pseudoxanthomonas sp.]
MPIPPSSPATAATPPPHALLFGASGQIGRRVLVRLLAAGWRVTASSRQPQPAQPGVAWRQAGLPDAGPGEGFDAILSCGPLDLFSQWYAATPTGRARVVAFGSTSVHVKGDSTDPHERDLARRLREAEARLAQAAAARGAAGALLRPTLVYGAGMDRNLSRIAALARRWHGFVLPHDARGLRQPVHVDDLADAAMAALAMSGAETPAGSSSAVGPDGAGGLRAYDLPGGETLAYREMVARVLAVQRPPLRLWRLPGPLFDLAAALARMLGVHDAGAAVLARMRQDLVFDDAAARRALGYAPRPFRPDPAMFEPPV